MTSLCIILQGLACGVGLANFATTKVAARSTGLELTNYVLGPVYVRPCAIFDSAVMAG